MGIDCRTIGDFIGNLSSKYEGVCETGAMMGWRLIRHYIPDMKFVVVRRDREAVLRSLATFGLAGYETEMKRRDDQLDVIAALPGTLAVDYSELLALEGCKSIYEFCLDRPMRVKRWEDLAAINIQVSMPQRLEKIRRNAADLEYLKASVMAEQDAMGGEACQLLH